MFSAYIRNMSNQNKLNLTLMGKTVMENISLSVKTRKHGYLIPKLKSTDDHSICFDDALCSAKITVNYVGNNITVSVSCSLKDSPSPLPDSFDDVRSVVIEFSAPQANLSLAQYEKEGSCLPAFTNFNTMPDNTVNLLTKCDKGYARYKPISGDRYRSRLSGLGTHAALILSIGCSGYNTLCGNVLSIQYDTDPYALLSSAPASADVFNCTDRVGFYGGTLNADEILLRVERCKQRNLPIKLVVLDLYDTRPMQSDIYADQKRFPQGLAVLIKTLKQRYGVMHIGIRYPLGLAHRGIAENSSAHSLLKPFTVKTHGGYIIPACNFDRALSLYDTIHKYLLREGISFVVASMQSSLLGCCNGYVSIGEADGVYMPAFRQSARAVFGSLLSDKSLPLSNIGIKTRIICDAYLSTLSAEDAQGCFTTYQFSGRQSSAFFAVSGSQLFLNDIPDRDMSGFLSHAGSVLRCDGKMMVCRRNLFSDPSCDGKLLRVFNRCNGAGVLAAFNVSEKGETVKGDVCADDIEGLKGNRFVCHLTRENKFIIAGRDTRIPLSLGKHDAELIIFTPIKDGFAFLGNINKILPPATFSLHENICHLCDMGVVALYSEKKFESDLKFEKCGNIFTANADHGNFTLSVE